MTKYDAFCFYETKDIVYETKDIAMDVLKHMEDLARSCGYVTMNQYLEMSGIDECVEGGNEWGWYAKTIMDAVVVKTRCGYLLNLGTPVDISTLENMPNDQTEKNAYPYKSGKYPFGYDPNTESAILINHAAESIQNYIKYGNLNNLKAARDILIAAIIELEDKESEEK